MIRIVLIIVAFCSVLFAFEQKAPFSTVELRDTSFQDFVTESRSILFFPFILHNSFLETPTFEKITKPLNIRHERIVPHWYPKVLATVDQPTKNRIHRFENEILLNNTVESHNHLTVFESLGFRYIQLFYISSFSNISRRNGITEKQVTVKTILMDTHLKRSVYKASATTQSSSKNRSDEEIVLEAIELLYEMLPRFYFNTSDRNW